MSDFGSFLSLALAIAATWVTGGAYATWAGWIMAASVAVRLVDAREDMRRARSTARRDFNASLEDRMEMVDVTPDQARTMVLGRVRTVEGVRRRWVSGANNQKLTMVVSFAGHEIDGFEQFYFDDVPVVLDTLGYVLTAPYNKIADESRLVGNLLLDAAGQGVAVLPGVPVAGSVSGMWSTGVGDSLSQGVLTVVVSGNTVTLSNAPAGAAAAVLWQETVSRPTARIRAFTGSASQNVGAALAAEYPGKITANDRFAGMAVAVIDIDYDPDVYTQGRPNVTAVLRGARVYDPRKDSTQGGAGAHRASQPATWEFCETPALHALHFARDLAGWAVPLAELRLADFASAAVACDITTPLTLRKPDNSTSTVTLPRYRCGIVIKLEGSRRAPMEEIMKTMAGRWGWAGGTLRMRAGAVPAAKVFDLQPSWIAQRIDEGGEPDNSAVVRITNGVTREQRVNRVTGRCVNPAERWQALPYPAVQDSTLMAQDGGVYALEEDYDGVNHPAHAQHLATVAIRQTQAALRLQLSCNLSAYRLELFDRGGVTLPRFGMASKSAEVVGWRWHPTEGVALTLAEIEPAMFEPVSELRGFDPAPNSNLPAPWNVQRVTGVQVDSGTSALTDGSILTRTRITWGAVAQGSVRAGGTVEVQYAEVTAIPASGEWPSWVEQGSSAAATIPGLRAGRVYVFRVRAVQGLPLVRGPWSMHAVHLVAAAPAVTLLGLGYTGALNATAGAVLNSDPGCSTPALWSEVGAGFTVASVADGISGPTVWRKGAAGVQSYTLSNRIAVDRAKTYRAKWWMRRSAGADGLAFPAVSLRDGAGALIAGDGGLWHYPVNSFLPSLNWVEYIATFGAGTLRAIPANAATIAVGAFLGYECSTGFHEMQGVRLEEVTDLHAAAARANAAQVSADTANAVLVQIASDSVLSRGEKPRVILDYDAIVAEAVGIDSQAAAFGVTVERINYRDARDYLTAYLVGLNGWADLGIDTAIDGPVLRAKFADVYLKRQLLLNQIAVLASQRAVWANVTGVTVTTAQMAPGAATAVYVDTDQEIEVTGQTGVPYGGITVVNQISFTSDITGDCLVTVSGGGYHIAGSQSEVWFDKEYATCRGSLVVIESGSPLSRIAVVRYLAEFCGLNERRDFQITLTRRVQLTQGSTYTIWFDCQKFGIYANLRVTTEMRIEVIKR